jgi:hypothetical protein
MADERLKDVKGIPAAAPFNQVVDLITKNE